MSQSWSGTVSGSVLHGLQRHAGKWRRPVGVGQPASPYAPSTLLRMHIVVGSEDSPCTWSGLNRTQPVNQAIANRTQRPYTGWFAHGSKLLNPRQSAYLLPPAAIDACAAAQGCPSVHLVFAAAVSCLHRRTYLLEMMKPACPLRSIPIPSSLQMSQLSEGGMAQGKNCTEGWRQGKDR